MRWSKKILAAAAAVAPAAVAPALLVRVAELDDLELVVVTISLRLWLFVGWQAEHGAAEWYAGAAALRDTL